MKLGTVVLALLLATSVQEHTAAAAGTKNAIQCYSSMARAPGQRPAVTPLNFPRKDGFGACLRYQYRCTVDTPTCLANEIGALKWHYYASSTNQCRNLIASATRLGLRSVFCCLADKCNVPDKQRDPQTQVIPDSWLSRSINQAPRMTNLAAPVAAVAPSKNATQLSGVPAEPVLAGQSLKQQQMTCMYSIPTVPGQPSEVASLLTEPDAPVCVRYQVRCSLANTACSPSDVTRNNWKWVYGAISKAQCEALKAGKPVWSKGVKNGYCCTNPDCNKPDAKLDWVTRISNTAQLLQADADEEQQQQQQTDADQEALEQQQQQQQQDVFTQPPVVAAGSSSYSSSSSSSSSSSFGTSSSSWSSRWSSSSGK